MKKTGFIFLFIALPLLAQGSVPLWVQDSWRSMNYPANEWYVGFSQDGLAHNANVAEALRTLERNAQGRMAESIVASVSSRSVSSTSSQQRQQGGNFNETIDESYRRTIQVSTNANIAGTQFFSYHDPQTRRIYAMAAVKKSGLAAYYVSQIELNLQKAENALNEGILLTQQLGKKSDAFKKFAEGRRNLDDCGQHLNLLSAVDQSGIQNRLLARETTLRKQIAAATAETEETKMAMTFFVDGTEMLENAAVDIVVSRLKSAISKNGYRITGSRREAEYHIRVEVRSCNVSASGDRSFCYACVKAEVINLKTGRNEGRVDFTGPKTGWRDRETACRKALENAVDELWKRINQDIKIFK